MGLNFAADLSSGEQTEEERVSRASGKEVMT